MAVHLVVRDGQLSLHPGRMSRPSHRILIQPQWNLLILISLTGTQEADGGIVQTIASSIGLRATFQLVGDSILLRVI